MGPEILEQRAANSLAAALVARSAAAAGIHAILIKGLSLEFHALRTGHVSADVDVIVEPGRAAELAEGFVAGGWVERPATLGGTRTTDHSVALIRDGWPTDIDVHHQYPGLLVGPERAFEVLWEHRLSAEVAGISTWIPDRSSAIVLWALHSLRGTDINPRHRFELDDLVTRVIPGLATPELDELAKRIVELGADRPLRPVPAFSRILGDASSAVDQDAVDVWERKLAQVHEVTPWLQVLREAAPRERPFLLWRAVWPSPQDLRLLDPGLVDSPGGRLRSRFSRIARFAKRLASPGSRFRRLRFRGRGSATS